MLFCVLCAGPRAAFPMFFPWRARHRQTGARRARQAQLPHGVPQEAAMDRSLHPARPQNQTLVLSNHLVITTVEFLNKFAEECDAKPKALVPKHLVDCLSNGPEDC